MDVNVNISYTLRLVLDDLKTRLSQLIQNVTSYDHLMYVETELRDHESNLHSVREHYGKISNIQDKIREEVQHINAQLRIFYDERFSNENDDVKKTWIINTSKTLKNEFEETMSKLRVMQQNFIQTHKSKIFDLERQIDPSNPSNLNVQEKIELYRNSMSRCETDIHLNNQKLEQLKMHLSHGASFDNLQNYDTVDISPRVTAIHPVPIDRSFDSGVTLETLNRKQHLLLVVIAATTLMLIVTLILIR